MAGRIVVVEHRPVLRRLIGEDAALHADVRLHRAVTRDVILRDVEHRTDVRVERADRLALIGADLGHRQVVVRHVARVRGDRIADVAHDVRGAARRAEQLAHQRGGRRLAVGAGDGAQAAAHHARAQLQFADDLHAARNRLLHERLGDWNARAEDHHVLIRQVLLRALAKRKGASERLQLIQRAAEALLRLHVADRHDRAPLGQQLCRRHTAARHAQHDHAFILHVHVSASLRAHRLSHTNVQSLSLGQNRKPILSTSSEEA